MTKTLLTPIRWLGCAALTTSLWAQEAPTTAALAQAIEASAAPSSPGPRAQSGLRFNFRGAPLETVLNYMSDAAGFIKLNALRLRLLKRGHG